MALQMSYVPATADDDDTPMTAYFRIHSLTMDCVTNMAAPMIAVYKSRSAFTHGKRCYEVLEPSTRFLPPEPYLMRQTCLIDVTNSAPNIKKQIYNWIKALPGWETATDVNE
jgi:hypothetical protein